MSVSDHVPVESEPEWGKENFGLQQVPTNSLRTQRQTVVPVWGWSWSGLDLLLPGLHTLSDGESHALRFSLKWSLMEPAESDDCGR